MRNATLKTLSILTVTAVVVFGFNAKAELDPNMEAAVTCSTPDCMFRGNPQTHDALGGAQRITLPGGAHMYNVNRFQDNPDQVVNRGVETQYAPIGEIETNRQVVTATGKASEFGSGFLVSPCYAVTNAHVVFGERNPVPGTDYSVKFHVGVSAAGSFEGTTVATPVAWGTRDASGKNDWAVVKLTTCVGKRPEIGWFETANISSAQLVGKKVAVAGYATDRQRGQLSAGVGVVKGIDRGSETLTTTASAAPGQSGGAVITVDNGTLKVVGIYSGTVKDQKNPDRVEYASYSSDHANEFVNLSDILSRPDVKAMIDADKRGLQNPALASMTRPLPSVQTASIQ